MGRIAKLKRVIPVYWHRSVNFGDAIAPYLVEKMTKCKTVYVNYNEKVDHVALIGSLLDVGALNNTYVWGCGFAYEETNPHPPKFIYAVRGELTRQKYNSVDIDCPFIFGDPAMLLPRYYNPVIKKKYKIGIIPHVVDYIEVLKHYGNVHNDVLIIDLTKLVEEVINDMLSCETIISSSLHGLIVPHAYNIPSVWAVFSDKVLGNGFKFRDYFTTIFHYDSPVLLDQPIDLTKFPDIKLINIEYFLPETSIDIDGLISVCPFMK